MDYNDLIYYKQDIIESYSSKRKGLEKRDVEELLDCALLFLEVKAKQSESSSIEIPNIGFLHKKLDFSELEKMTSLIKKEDDTLIKTVYADTKFSPIVTRKLMLEQYYPGIALKELQRTQNDK